MSYEGTACFTVFLVPKAAKPWTTLFMKKDRAQENLNIGRENVHVINGFSALKNNI